MISQHEKLLNFYEQVISKTKPLTQEEFGVFKLYKKAHQNIAHAVVEKDGVMIFPRFNDLKAPYIAHGVAFEHGIEGVLEKLKTAAEKAGLTQPENV